MKMGHTIDLVIVLLLSLVSNGSGLSLSLDFNETPVFGASSAACVLACEESYVTSDSSLDQDQTSSNSSASSTITGMSIFATRASSPANCDPGNGQPVAYLTLEQPNITSASGNIRINGRLDTSRADLRLEILNDRDCFAGFVCEVSVKDVNGRKIKNTNRLQQQKQQRNDGSVFTSSESSQTTVIIQQLALLENRLEDKIKSLEDKIERRVIDRLRQLEARLPAETPRVVVEAENTCGRDEFRVKQEEVLNNTVAISERVETNLNKSLWFLSSIEKQLKQLQNCNITCCTGSINVTEKTDEFFSLILKCLSLQTKRNVSFIDTCKLLEELKKLNINTCNTSTEISSSTHEPVTTTTSALTANTTTTIAPTTNATTIPSTTPVKTTTTTTTTTHTNTSTTIATTPTLESRIPQNCSKGMPFSKVEPGFPYPVVSPNEYSDLDIPYLCDQNTNGGGWIIIQRRSIGDEDFYRDWATYRNGFGSLNGDFWIGNKHLHALTSIGTYELRVEMEIRGKSYFAQYDRFFIDSEEKNYALHLGHYRGNASDALIYHNRAPFSTYDNDNGQDTRNCAKLFVGAWWYKSCLSSNLNGMWDATGSKAAIWNGVTSSRSVTLSEMKIRLVDTQGTGGSS